jgi:hypothetical protein
VWSLQGLLLPSCISPNPHLTVMMTTFFASIVGWADDALSTESHWLNRLTYSSDYGHDGVCCGDDDNFLASIVGWADDALSTESHWLNHTFHLFLFAF